MNSSNKLYEDLLCTYSDFESTSEKTFKGYKLAEKRNLNYYSIVSGQFRYKPGRIGKSSYTSLYEKNDLCNEHLRDRLAVFVNKQDAIDALKNYTYEEYSDLVVLEIKVSGDMEKGIYTNKYISECEIYVGNTIENVHELEIIRKKVVKY